MFCDQLPAILPVNKRSLLLSELRGGMTDLPDTHTAHQVTLLHCVWTVWHIL